jgi:hypothetical protein
MDLSIIIALGSLIVASTALLHSIGAFRRVHDFLREREIQHKVKVSFSPPEGKIKWQNGYGLMKIHVMLTNNTPHKTFRNISGKFWTDEGIYASSTNVNPTKVGANVPYLYFIFNITILQKKTSAMISTLTPRVPKEKGDYVLGADLVADGLEDWRFFGYQLKVKDGRFKIEYKRERKHGQVRLDCTN